MKTTKNIRALISVALMVVSGLAAAESNPEGRSSTSNTGLFERNIIHASCDKAPSKLGASKLKGFGNGNVWSDVKIISTFLVFAVKTDVDCMAHPVRAAQIIASKGNLEATASAEMIHQAMKLIPWFTGDASSTEGAGYNRLMPAGSMSEQSAPHKRFDFRATFYKRAF